MDNYASSVKLSIKTSLAVIFGLLIGYIMNQEPMKDILDELSEIRESDVIGFLGTIYALITAFTLVNVWNHFDMTKRSFATENEALVALWVNTDYLEDSKISDLMKQALLKYLDVTMTDELPLLAKRNEVKLPSQEFIGIKKVIDQIRFDDVRDPVGFEALIIDFRSLTSARNGRIEALLIEVPKLLKYFYALSSIIFWIGFMIQGFTSVILYYIVLFLGTLIVVLSYTIIFDLDNPLEGLVRLNLRKYENSREFIETTDHEVFLSSSDHTLE